MPAIGTIFRVILQILAGVGVAEFMDKFFPDKVAGYSPVSPGFKPIRKLVFFIGAFAAGGLIWNFINRKFHILTPRHARKTSRRRQRRRSRRKR